LTAAEASSRQTGAQAIAQRTNRGVSEGNRGGGLGSTTAAACFASQRTESGQGCRCKRMRREGGDRGTLYRRDMAGFTEKKGEVRRRTRRVGRVLLVGVELTLGAHA
jgi:hypothetical protein